jgi:S1-C subfamily serine protease
MKKVLIVFFILLAGFLFALTSGNIFRSTKVSTNYILISPTEGVSKPAATPIIGIHYRMIDHTLADQNSMIEGAYVSQVIKNSPAEISGLMEEDIIFKIDGIQIGSEDKELINLLVSKKRHGDQINLEVWRNGQIKNILITLD